MRFKWQEDVFESDMGMMMKWLGVWCEEGAQSATPPAFLASDVAEV